MMVAIRCRSGTGSCLFFEGGRKCQETFKRSTTLDDVSFDQDLGNLTARAMSEDASIKLNGGIIGPEWKTTEGLLLVNQTVVNISQVIALDGASFTTVDPISEQAEVDGSIRRALHDTGNKGVIHGEYDVTQRSKLRCRLGVGLALTTGGGCENHHGELAFACGGLIHGLRHEIV